MNLNNKLAKITTKKDERDFSLDFSLHEFDIFACKSIVFFTRV